MPGVPPKTIMATDFFDALWRAAELRGMNPAEIAEEWHAVKIPMGGKAIG